MIAVTTAYVVDAPRHQASVLAQPGDPPAPDRQRRAAGAEAQERERDHHRGEVRPVGDRQHLDERNLVGQYGR